MASVVDRGAVGLSDELAERCAGDTKGDRAQLPRTRRIGERAAQMAISDRLGMGNAHSGKDKTRLRVGGAKRR